METLVFTRHSDLQIAFLKQISIQEASVVCCQFPHAICHAAVVARQEQVGAKISMLWGGNKVMKISPLDLNLDRVWPIFVLRTSQQVVKQELDNEKTQEHEWVEQEWSKLMKDKRRFGHIDKLWKMKLRQYRQAQKVGTLKKFINDEVWRKW